jgi:hypothetical protein
MKSEEYASIGALVVIAIGVGLLIAAFSYMLTRTPDPTNPASQSPLSGTFLTLFILGTVLATLGSCIFQVIPTKSGI